MNALQQAELDILKEFMKTAARERLKWFAGFGTLLGAVRYKGFIPWDDDIDIAMPRADYDRLRLSTGWFDEPYFLQTIHNDPAAAPRFLKLRRSDTAALGKFPNAMTRGGHMGIGIDIIPLDDVPDGVTARHMLGPANRINQQMYASAALDECSGTFLPDWKARQCYIFGGVEGLYPLFADRHEAYCSQYSDMPYYAMPALGNVRGGRVYEKEWFSHSIPMAFEDITVSVPVGWKEVLLITYPDGLAEPGLKERSASHTKDRVVDPCKSYKEYVRRYTDMLQDSEGKRIFLFGAGDSLRIWLERYGKGKDAVCTFDNGKNKWGTTAYGIPVCPPSDIPKMMDGNSSLIITSIYHESISAQLDAMGISEYHIFIDGLGYRDTFDS